MRLTRPVFLLGGALLYGFGAAAASTAGIAIDWRKYLLGQLLVTCIQLFAQYTNEFFDLDTDRLNSPGRTWFSGGSGVLPSGAIPVETAFHAARAFGITALALTLGLSFDSPLVSLIGFMAILGAWYYSAPPLSLVSSGFGELVASIIVCSLVPLTATIIQTGGSLPVYLVGTLPLLFVHVAMLITFALPDFRADHQVGKQTLVVRLGLERSAVWHNRLIILGFAVLGALAFVSFLPARFAWVTLPLALWQIISVKKFARNPSNNPNRLTFTAVALFALLAGLLLIDILLFG